MDWRETFREAVPAVSDQPGLFDEPLSGPDLEMAVHESAFSLTEADHHMATLLREIDWQQEEIRMFGKTMPIPRSLPGTATTASATPIRELRCIRQGGRTALHLFASG